MWNLENNRNESTYKTERDSQTEQTWLPKGKEGMDKLGVWDQLKQLYIKGFPWWFSSREATCSAGDA